MGETKLQREIDRRERDLRRSIGMSIRDLREDAALTRTAVATAAGIDRSFMGRIESSEREPSLSTLVAISMVLGADLSVKLYPTTGPRLRDRVQAAMVEALIAYLGRPWIAHPEVPVHRPARGVIDLVLTNRTTPLIIATEVHSELRRLEQQLRWHRMKEESLPSADLWQFASAGAVLATSRLLVLRSTRTMRELAAAFQATFQAAYGARTRDAVATLAGGNGTWPGPSVIWIAVDGGRARVLEDPPRGVHLGR